MADYQQGGHHATRYLLRYSDGREVPANAKNFVLSYDEDPHARVALAAYAESVAAENPRLAADIRAELDHSQPAFQKAYAEARGQALANDRGEIMALLLKRYSGGFVVLPDGKLEEVVLASTNLQQVADRYGIPPHAGRYLVVQDPLAGQSARPGPRPVG
jgi:hypothetical protein